MGGVSLRISRELSLGVSHRDVPNTASYPFRRTNHVSAVQDRLWPVRGSNVACSWFCGRLFGSSLWNEFSRKKRPEYSVFYYCLYLCTFMLYHFRSDGFGHAAAQSRRSLESFDRLRRPQRAHVQRALLFCARRTPKVELGVI